MSAYVAMAAHVVNIGYEALNLEGSYLCYFLKYFENSKRFVKLKGPFIVSTRNPVGFALLYTGNSHLHAHAPLYVHALTLLFFKGIKGIMQTMSQHNLQGVA